MKKSIFRLFLGAVISSWMAVAPVAGENSMIVKNPWARETPPVATTGAVFLSLLNEGQTPDRLLGISGAVASRIELHTHLHEDGVMKMRRVDTLEVAPAAPIEFKPGGLHIMLIGLQAALKKGQRFPLTLRFENAGDISVEVTVRGIDTQ